MSGHSKWANIQHRKGRQDAKRGKEFTKAAKEIIIAAKNGGDPASNSRLRAAIAAAKSINLPKDKIEAAIRKGTGQDAGGDIIEINYEGYGPGGVAVIVETATDNRNRTVAEIRHLMSKGGGSMGENGCVSWKFERKGVIQFSKEKYTEDQLMEAALEAGADDLRVDAVVRVGAAGHLPCQHVGHDDIEGVGRDLAHLRQLLDVAAVQRLADLVDGDAVRLADDVERGLAERAHRHDQRAGLGHGKPKLVHRVELVVLAH